jgi:ABC-type bacteriocin/lantibiotic exporter with double-glycine peptidase domain
MMTNMPLAKAFAKEEYEQKRGEEFTSRLYKISIKSSWIDQCKDLSETAVSLLQSLIITLIAMSLFQGGTITKRAWIAFFMFSGVFMSAVTNLTLTWNNIKIIQGGADRLSEIMNAPEEPQAGKPCGKLTGDICLEHISFGYKEDKMVLQDVTCKFQSHNVTALLGVSGCGKTTLANLIARLYSPNSGVITIDGQNIADYALEDYRNNFVFVSQNAMLFSGTIRDNICYSNKAMSDDVIIEALKQAGAFEFVWKLPEKLDTILDEYGNNLSGGQRQKLAMARALLSDAYYLILDEPVASMDAIATSEMMRVLKDKTKECCTIIIAHTSAILNFVQRVVILEDGIVKGEGTAEEVLACSKFFKEFMREKVTE